MRRTPGWVVSPEEVQRRKDAGQSIVIERFGPTYSTEGCDIPNEWECQPIWDIAIFADDAPGDTREEKWLHSLRSTGKNVTRVELDARFVEGEAFDRYVPIIRWWVA